jgi:NADPH-dependent 2,4-dienoyl-CoA reductase/sulfur reductase-like enzyme
MPPPPAEPGRPLRCDVAVIGGGPAGLAAAAQLGRAGADVVLLDEAPSLGGQYFKRRQGAVLASGGDYRPAGSRLIEEVRQAGVRCLAGQLVWGVDDDGGTLLTAGTVSGTGLAITPRACLVATGAYERAVPFPGWQLPGVVTAGHALHLATCDRIPLGQRVIVAGTGPFLLAAACAVLQADGGVAAVVELNRPYAPGTAALAAARFPARLRELAAYAATLARHRVPVLQGRRVLAAEGEGQVREVLIGPRAAAWPGSAAVPGASRSTGSRSASGSGPPPSCCGCSAPTAPKTSSVTSSPGLMSSGGPACPASTRPARPARSPACGPPWPAVSWPPPRSRPTSACPRRLPPGGGRRRPGWPPSAASPR